MDSTKIDELRLQIAEHEHRLRELKEELARAEQSTYSTTKANVPSQPPTSTSTTMSSWRWPLSADEYKRYGRQMILPEVGLQGQLRLKSAKVLVIGLGGLGCPVASYLAGAGIGTLGLMDGDTVELSNLHRQILHTTQKVGKLKVESASEALQNLNPLVNYTLHPTHLRSTIALETFARYDLILDCTDNPATRYLISDSAVLASKPLISASALRTDGQLLVLNHPPTPPLPQREASGNNGGPCYRCVFPMPPPADAVLSCGEGGIMGPVVGAMGVLMALEAMKLVMSSAGPTPSATIPSAQVPLSAQRQSREHSMLIFSATSSPLFRSIRLKGKRAGCAGCSERATVTAEALSSGTLDHVAFCGIRNPIRVLNEGDRVSAEDFGGLARRREKHGGRQGEGEVEDYVLLDVRDETQFGLCALDGSVNISWISLQGIKEQNIPVTNGHVGVNLDGGTSDPDDPLYSLRREVQGKDIYTICRFGNDSQLAVQKLRELGFDIGGEKKIRDIVGGFRAWKQDVDPSWPEY